jgi:hypothetical protein
LATRNSSCAEGDFSVVCGARIISRLCSQFVSIAEVDERRAVQAIDG